MTFIDRLITIRPSILMKIVPDTGTVLIFFAYTPSEQDLEPISQLLQIPGVVLFDEEPQKKSIQIKGTLRLADVVKALFESWTAEGKRVEAEILSANGYQKISVMQ